jgi:hypothetical protein
LQPLQLCTASLNNLQIERYCLVKYDAGTASHPTESGLHSYTHENFKSHSQQIGEWDDGFSEKEEEEEEEG